MEFLIENVWIEKIDPYILNIQKKVDKMQMHCQTVKSIVSCCIGKNPVTDAQCALISGIMV